MASIQGEPGRTLQQQLAVVRRARGLSQQGLARRTEELGRRILASSIAKIETGERRVDVDDLFVLAAALNVTPLRLVLPDDAGTESTFAVTPTTATSGWVAWDWARGNASLSSADEEGGSDEAADAYFAVLPRQLRWADQHPALRAVEQLRGKVSRVVATVSRPRSKRSEALPTTVAAARRAVGRVEAELDDLEEGR